MTGTLTHLQKNLRWIDRNAVRLNPKTNTKKEQLVHISQRDSRPWSVFIIAIKAIRVMNVKKWEIQERRKTHCEKKSYFNYTGTQHRAAACKSKRTFQITLRKHYMSICDKPGNVILTTENLVSTLLLF